jgi:hypothetical protein
MVKVICLIRLAKKRKRFTILSGKKALDVELHTLPDEGVCYKFLSDGTFSAICFILSIAEKVKINHMYVSTFRVGKKEILTLRHLSDKGLLGDVHFVFCGLMETDKYPYYRVLKQVCDEKGWEYTSMGNHSKVILFDTDDGKYVLETSSNLNENPKIEQYSFEKDTELFDFYRKNLFGGEDDIAD